MRLVTPFALLAITTFAYQFAFAVSRSIQSNFFVEVLHVRADQMGWMTTVRETPGFLMFLIAALTMRFAPPRLGAVCMLLMGVGYAAYALATSFATVLPGVVIASIGFHTWLTLGNAFGLAVAREGEAGQTLGKLQSIGFAAALVAMGLTLLLIDRIGFHVAFVGSALVFLVAVVAISRFPKDLVKRSPDSIVFRRKYGLFYALNFLDGCRMEVFQAFGVYLLVQQYAVDVQTITLLLIVSSVINMALSERVGRLIDTLGERRTMTFSYVALFFVFLGFALVPDRTLAIGLYVAYNFFLLFSMGINTYLKRIAPPEDVRGCLAMGVTTMHVSAMVLPPIGGLLWVQFGFQAPFLLGAVFIGLAVLVTQRIPKREAVSVPLPSAAG